MAYKKKGGRRRNYRRRGKKPMRYKVADLAYTAYKGVQYLKDLINVETKYLDFVLPPTTCAAAGSISGFAAIPQGTQQSQRIGDSVKLQTLSIKGQIFANNAAGTSNVRVIVFKGNKENGSFPSVTDILQTADWLSPKGWADRFDSKVLFDKIYSFSNTGNMIKNFDWTFKLNWHTNYAPTTTNIEDGGIYMLYITDLAATQPGIEFYARLFYTDD